MSLKIHFFIILIASVVFEIYSAKQKISFHTGFLGTGTFVGFDSKQPELTNWKDFISKANSFCATGWWKLHQLPNYEPKGEGENYWISAWTEEQCRNIDQDRLNANQGSLRHFGPDNLSDGSISIYTETSNNGEETTVTIADQTKNNINFPIESVFVTGNSSWQFFEMIDFRGASCCLRSTGLVTEVRIVLDPVMKESKSLTAGCTGSAIPCKL